MWCYVYWIFSGCFYYIVHLSFTSDKITVSCPKKAGWDCVSVKYSFVCFVCLRILSHFASQNQRRLCRCFHLSAAELHCHFQTAHVTWITKHHLKVTPISDAGEKERSLKKKKVNSEFVYERFRHVQDNCVFKYCFIYRSWRTIFLKVSHFKWQCCECLESINLNILLLSMYEPSTWPH